ncbi:MAG: PDZ domain-containing protein, partial [Phycisphaerales bacterium]|nr:PDZ domain-containing protein [Phycisphaerales bacterium]
AIGNLDEEGILVHGVGTAFGLEARIEYHFDASDAFIRTERDSSRRSDDETFRRQRLPALHVETTLPETFASPDDDASAIHRAGLVEVVDLVERIALSLCTDTEGLVYTDPSDRSDQVEVARGPRVRVGIQAAEDPGGVRVVQVFPGTAAADAGLEPGDVLTVWDGHPLTLRMYMSLIGGHDPGDEVDVTLQRDGETLERTLQLRGD